MRRLIFICLIAFGFNQTIYQQIRINQPTPQTISIIQEMGIDLDHIHHKKGIFLEFAIPEPQVRELLLQGFDIEIIHEDLQLFYSNRLSNEYVERDFDLGSMGGYYTFEETIDQINDLFENYPSLVSEPISIGQSFEGREVLAIKLSDNPNIDEDEPEVLLAGLHHAREPMSYMNLFYYMHWLVENYGTDPEATALLDNREIWFIPTVNPDGLVYNQEIAPNGGGMQRKNHRETCNNDDYNDWDGIDLNRNYSYQWAFDDEGSSPDPCGQTYRGTGPFSEPETEHIKDFVEAHDFPIVLNYHSYGNLLIHPLGYIAGLLPPEPDLTIFREFGDDMTQYNNYLMGTGIETVGYTVNGEACDWMYGEHGIFAYTPEIGNWQDGFWPATNRIVPLAEENLYPNQFVSWAVGAKYKAEIGELEEFYDQGSFFSTQLNLKNQGLGDSNGSVSMVIESSMFPSINMNLGELSARSELSYDLEFEIPYNIADGQSVDITVKFSDIDNFWFTNTFEILVGEPQELFFDGAESGLINWNSEGWGTSQSSYNGNYSFTDSPGENYEDDWALSSMTIDSPFDLTDYSNAFLQIMAKWQIEESWDWAQVLASTNQINWVSLQGELMESGSGNGVQSPLEYGYDDESDWITDNLSLAEFVGQEEVWIKFQMESDGHVNGDGIYVDDIRLFVYNVQSFITGDLNGDGGVNILDIVELVNIILGPGATPEQYQVADLNADNLLNVLDIILMVNLILGSSIPG